MLLAVALAGLALAALSPLIGHYLASPSAVTPAAVVKAYVAAINAHDYRRAWNLGGDHLGAASFRAFAAGYRKTKSVTILRLTATGDVVSMTTRAPETTGPVQWYSYTYVVSGGVIVQGEQTLLPAPS